MRKSLMVVGIMLFALTGLYSQSESDSALYKKGLALFKASGTTEKYLGTASYFEEAAIDNPDHWLVHYYAGLAYILAGQKATDSKLTDELLDKAQLFIDKSFALKQDDSELHALQAFLYQIRLQVNPQGRAISLSQKAEASLKKAMEADSTNPRAYFLMANNIYYTPPVFKGGPKNALPIFLKAREKFRTYQPELTFMPEWGAERNEEMIELCNNSAKKS